MIKTNCIHFPLDRPCRFHKTSGIKCRRCKRYAPVTALGGGQTKILLIKIGAMGDVLRTTFLLKGLRKKYNRPHITWVVAPHSADILAKNPYVSRVWNFDCAIFQKMAAETFDICINLDLAPESLSLATLAAAPKKIGYHLDGKRNVVCSGPHAKKWLEMSAFDDLKKKNKNTYQYWMSKIAGIDKADDEIYIPLEPSSVIKSLLFKKKHKLEGNIVVGINPGAGNRWKYKKWNDSGFLKLINALNTLGIKILLLGGTDEKELIDMLVKKSKGKAVSAGTDNSLLDFFALVNLCDIVVSGDTLALHAALGLKKNAVAVFGPTSSAEIEMYGRGAKIVTPAKCACCYLTDCAVRPDCMTLVTFESVMKAVEKYL
jgi:ADP-heptose:LPS heptosyltransferase